MSITTLRENRRRLESRKIRIRKKIRGVAGRPRVSVYFSNRNITAQVIDDAAGKTLAAVCSLEKGSAVKGKNLAAAKALGAALAEKAKAAGITTVVFDRNGKLYHGRVKAFAEALREKGLVL